MPRTKYRLNIELVNRLLGEKDWSQGKWAIAALVNPSTLSGKLDARIPFAEREGVSLATLRKLAKAIGYEDNYMELTLDDEGRPYRAVAIGQTSAAQSSAELAFTSDGLTIKAIAHHSVLNRITTERLTAAWRSLYSPEGSAPIDKIGGGSIVITMHADATATSDIIGSFLAWRLQHIGIYELLLLVPHESTRNAARLLFAHFDFLTTDMRARCESRLIAKERVMLATRAGMHIVQIDPTDVLSGASDEIEFAWDSMYKAWKATEAASSRRTKMAWDHASHAWQVAHELWQSDMIAKAADIAADAAQYAGFISSDPRHSDYDYDQASNAARRDARTALQLAKDVWHSTDSPWTMSSFPEECDVWRFRSTLLPLHIATAERYWNSAIVDDIPEQARFQVNTPITPQPTILFDDETFSESTALPLP